MTTLVRRRARKQPAEVRHEEILDAAIRVFARSSYHAAGTADIAREAGIAEPTIYRHFTSKRELYLAAVERSAGEVIEAWQEIVARTPDAAAALDAIGHWYRTSVITNPDLLQLRYRATANPDGEDVRELLRRGYEGVHGVVAGVIRRGQEQGAFSRSVNPEGAAWLFTGIGQVIDLAMLVGIESLLSESVIEAVGDTFEWGLAVDHD